MPSRSPAAESSPRPQTVGAFLDSAAQALIKKHDSFVIDDERWGDKRLRALLHLIHRQDGSRHGRLGYHAVYRAVDLIERTEHTGIVVANPQVRAAALYGTHDPQTTSRHYKVSPNGIDVIREDIVRGEIETIINLSGVVSSTGNYRDIPLNPRDPTPVNQLKEDLLDVFVATPVIPETVIPFRI